MPHISRQPVCRSVPSVLAALALGALAPTPAHAGEFARAIEAAHGAGAWRAHAAVQADIDLEFGGAPVLAGTLLMDTPGGRTRLDLPNGVALGFDGTDAWVSPADAEFPRARFHALTWSYFLAVPMKLRDPGTHVEDIGPTLLRDGERLAAARLTFGAGVGDTPDDWYILYRDAESNRLAGMAYIVTYGTPKAEAEGEPHAITYGGWQQVDGVWIPTAWEFWLWTAEEGIHGDPIGHMRLTDVHFVAPPADGFAAPADSRPAELPASG